jgi:hypothetical protein
MFDEYKLEVRVLGHTAPEGDWEGGPPYGAGHCARD